MHSDHRGVVAHQLQALIQADELRRAQRHGARILACSGLKRFARAHDGVREEMLGGSTDAVYKFGLYGETSGQLDENGLPERFNWSAHYAGKTCVVYGHTPVAEPECSRFVPALLASGEARKVACHLVNPPSRDHA